MDVHDAIDLAVKELIRAKSRYKPMTTLHDGYALILEELDELFNAIKDDQFNTVQVRQEAIQVAAMALRFIIDLT